MIANEDDHSQPPQRFEVEVRQVLSNLDMSFLTGAETKVTETVSYLSFLPPADQLFKVVCLYDKRDSTLWELLRQHLVPLFAFYEPMVQVIICEVENKLRLQRDLEPTGIGTHLQEAHLILLGMSSDLVATLFGHGRFVYEQLQAVTAPSFWLDKHLLPIMLRTVSLAHVDLRLLRSMPQGYKAISGSRDKDVVCAEITHLLERTIQKMLQSRKEISLWVCPVCRTIGTIDPVSVREERADIWVAERFAEQEHHRIIPTCQATCRNPYVIKVVNPIVHTSRIMLETLPTWAIDPVCVFYGYV